MGKGKGWRIDVENPVPGVRDGQMHLQDYSGNKWQYDFGAGEFSGVPRSLGKTLAAIGVRSAPSNRGCAI